MLYHNALLSREQPPFAPWEPQGNTNSPAQPLNNEDIIEI
ncbi:hypothetical protein SNOG_06843 [Parastagonospora nodorum SN15]|uniref:Uncharacterized protein n=1 Tax=Phaeosphaeria nodorum (strain SN15 / ATCC MYA-4574 / FGSC 10173) TaxID=321614 RepID=Q0UN21_PHANO|nr:hypothetical protein SNOG_06843 [Parastagonospora nodorum SN15]EAT85494.1 hypothetical protein SNOG_06843 [Parastagonospora nodorum SN15]